MSSGLFGRFLNEVALPVILTLSSAEVETSCLKNNAYLHELLTLASATPAAGSASTSRIRFERFQESKGKSCHVLENALRNNVTAFPLSSLPSDPRDFITSPQSRPNSWSSDIESIFLRGFSFNEAECLSTPIALLFAVSTRDHDPAACLLELSSQHHSPDCFRNVLYCLRSYLCPFNFSSSYLLNLFILFFILKYPSAHC